MAAPLTDRPDPEVLLTISSLRPDNGCQHPRNPPLGHGGIIKIISESYVWSCGSKWQQNETKKAREKCYLTYGTL